MNDVVVVRSGSPEDLAAVYAMERVAFNDPWSQESLFGELIGDGMRMPLVAELDGNVCGYLMAWRVVDQLHILNIATDPNYLRRGVATALLMAEIPLEVRRSNVGAREFYKRHHFADTGVRPGYYQEDGEDAIIMTASCSDLVIE